MLGFEPSWRAPYDVAQLGEERFDSLVEQLADAPCPLLDESGVCSIYAHRPFICRLMGLGIETPQNDVVPNSCPIQAEFPAYNALPAQPFDLEAWEREEDLALQNGSLALFGSETQRHFETTIATAILL